MGRETNPSYNMDPITAQEALSDPNFGWYFSALWPRIPESDKGNGLETETQSYQPQNSRQN